MGQPITHRPSISVWVGMPRRVSRVPAVMAEVVVIACSVVLEVALQASLPALTLIRRRIAFSERRV